MNSKDLEIIKIFKKNKNNTEFILKEIDTKKYRYSECICSSALIYACKNKMIEVALKLIETGQSKPELIDEDERTALIHACSNNMTEVALKLIETGQSIPEQIDEYNFTALICACNNKMTEVALKLIETGQSKPEQYTEKDNTALILACSNNMSEVALKLIETGQSEPDHVNINDVTALILACKNNMSEVALKLIETGQSNPDQVNNNNNTALIYACNNNMSEVALKLIETGQSNPDHINNDENTALILACAKKMSEVALKLIETGESIPEHDNDNENTALILACYNKMTEVALKLIETGESNPQQVNKNGFTALIYACNNNMTDVALKILETGMSNYEHTTGKIKPAIYYAKKNNMMAVISMLENIKITDYELEFNVNENGFDPVNQETKKIVDYLKESTNNISLKINNTYYLISKKDLVTQLNNKANIKYGCKQAGNDSFYVTDDNIINNFKYFSLSAIIGLQILVDYNKLIDIINKVVDGSTNNIYVLKQTLKKFPSIISQEFIDGGSGVSADHCQTGKETYIYDIYPAKQIIKDITINNNENISSINEVANEIKNEIKIQYKTNTFTFPITETNTLDEIKTIFLNKLLQDNLITDINQNVKFIYKGKIYTDGNIILSNIENPPFGITLQAMVSPKIGGKRTKKNKKHKLNNKKTKKNRKKHKLNNKKTKKNRKC